MKNMKLYFFSLLMLSLTACGTHKSFNSSITEDDAYWSRSDAAKKLQSIEEVEKIGKSGKGPSSSYQNYEPGNQVKSGEEPSGYDQAGAQNAYDEWNKKRGLTTSSGNSEAEVSGSNKNQGAVIEEEKNDYRDARRFGSERTYYYDDPYYNTLSSNWGWTSFYHPIVRPGYYNWAPGWNIGFGYSSYDGWNYGMGYGMSYGYGMWNNPYYGYGMYNPYAYDPWGYGYGYHPYGYSPYGYSPYGYSPYGYSPYGYHHNGYHHNDCGNHHNNWGNGNDIVTNRPMLRPRNSMGSSIPAGSQPRNYTPDGHSNRPTVESGTNVVNQSGNPAQPAFSKPARPTESENAYRPNRPDINSGGSVSSDKPGGELKNDLNGKPVYVSPKPNPSDRTPPENVATNRPGGELKNDINGRPVYVSPNSNPSDRTKPENVSTNRPGGDLIQGSNGTQIYIPSRERSYNNSTSENPGVNSPGRSENNRSGRGDYSRPNRGDRGSNNSLPNNNNYNNAPVPRSSYSPPQNAPAPSYSAPSRSQPSYSAPSSPSQSSPSPRSGGGGSSGGSSGSGGGGSAPRSRPR